MSIPIKKNLTPSKYSIDVYENSDKSLVLILKKGKTKLWLGNITRGELEIDVGSRSIDRLEAAATLGIKLDSDGYILISGQGLEHTQGKLDRILSILQDTDEQL